ncbi:MAG: sulfate adenylyltransferase subunit CysN [Phycisphaeraceae bacterium]|nr:sulfate adenylyltransferase subunit CysN [Phycisphaeraceae bacterium]
MSHQSELIATDIDAYLAQHERKELLRFLTCGSVDDGKSTLIGRLLYDSKMVYEDQLAAVKKDSIKHGTTDTEFDPALLTDGLKAEREQGITIDVAYRYFSTARRKFIIADTPGHEQYTRNMATGASMCDLAIILIDARQGVLTQTRRHSFIASLLGIQHVVVAVNKMDLVDYDQATFDRICSQYSDFAAKLEMKDVRFVPISALHGENVVKSSGHMDWYRGATLMHILENVHIASDRNLIDFRFPVQYVNRPNLNFRGYCGTIASGVVRPGDQVAVLPSGRASQVKSIVNFDGEMDEAHAPLAVTLTLADEIDVSRGDMIVHLNNRPTVERRFEAMMVWMAEEDLEPGRAYLFKQTSRTTAGAVEQVRYRMDVNTLHRETTRTLGLNEIGRVSVELEQPIAFDAYKNNRTTGAFIVIDRMTNNTVGAGMILDRRAGDETDQTRRRVAESLRRYAERHPGHVDAEARADRFGHQAVTVCFTGLRGSGKSTLAYALEQRLFEQQVNAFVLDGRNARLGLNIDLDFSESGRSENIRRAAEVAKLFNRAGLISLLAFIAPDAEDRAQAAQIVGPDRFVEIHLAASLEVCRERDETGLYEKAEAGLIAHLPGLNAPYDAPQNPALRLETDREDVDSCLKKILELLKQRGVIG